MAGFGLSRMLQGASAGMQNNIAMLDRKDDRARDDTLFQQGQEDRAYTLDRRSTIDQRQDEEYAYIEELRDYQTEFNKAMSRYGMSGGQDYEGLTEFAKKHLGVDSKINRNRDGTFNLELMRDGQSINRGQNMSFDDLGAMAMSMRDPSAYLDYRKAKAAKASDNAFELTKIDRKGAWDLRIKQAGETETGTGGSTGLASKLGKEQRMIVDQGLGSLRQTYGGKLEGGFWYPDEANKDEAMVAFSLLEKKVRGGATNGQQAALEARQEAITIAQLADAQLEKEDLDGETAARRRTQLILDFGLQLSQRDGARSPRETATGGLIQRSGTSYESKSEPANGGARSEGLNSAHIPQEAIEFLKSNDTAYMRRSFDEWYGQGEAARALGETGGVQLRRENRLARTQEQPRNPRKEFDDLNRSMTNGLKARNKDYARYVIEKLNPDYMMRLTPKQREKARVHQANAKAVLGMAE